MARNIRTSDRPVTLSVLDRLLDISPYDKSEEPSTRAQSIRQHKDAVRRDLEWLLNTRRIATLSEESYAELEKSVYLYGLPDFSALSLASAQDQAKLLRSVQTTIELFEPRLTGVRVIPIRVEGINTNALRFRIEGLLDMDPAPEHVSFDTVLELSRGEYEVKEL